MPFLDRGGVSIAYEAAGSGPTVLLSHGYSASSAMFAGIVSEIRDGHRVVTWDLRGHANSGAPEDPAEYSADLAVGDMLALLDAVGASRAVVGGHSLGGYLSLLLAVTAPERVEALVLIGTGPGFRKDEARARWNATAEKFAKRFDERGLAAVGSGAEVAMARHTSARGLALAARGILSQRDSTVIDALPSISVPTLIIVGDQDEAYLDGSRYMAAKIPGSRLEVIEGAGHAPNLDQPEAFARVVQEFLRHLPGRSAAGGAKMAP